MNKVLKEFLLKLQSQANNVNNLARESSLKIELAGITDWTLREEALESAQSAFQTVAQYHLFLANAYQAALSVNNTHLERSAALTIIQETNRRIVGDLEHLSSILAKAYALA